MAAKKKALAKCTFFLLETFLRIVLRAFPSSTHRGKARNEPSLESEDESRRYRVPSPIPHDYVARPWCFAAQHHPPIPNTRRLASQGDTSLISLLLFSVISSCHWTPRPG